MAEKHALIPNPLAMYTQTETKDMSKNLMTGDFEKQYSEKVKSSRWKQGCVVAAGVTLTALVVWLLVLVMVREVQLARLREEVDELTANVIAVSANVKSLNQKFSNNKQLLNDYKPDDTIYADEDQDITSLADKRPKHTPHYGADLEKLHGLTVLEDDEDSVDDDDLDEDDEVESGNWSYTDYDNRAEKIGTTNMVHLRPEDFTDSVVTFDNGDGKQAVKFSNIRELKRLLNENPENPDIPALIKPTEATKEADKTRSKRSVFPDASDVDQFAAPRVVTKGTERRKTKKYSSNMEAAPEKMKLHTVTRTVRNSEAGDGQRRPFIAAHFHGNTSHLSTETHEFYKGNGLVRLAHGAHHDVWSPAAWTSAYPNPTLTRNGHVHVHHTGVYLVYVQIYYLDSHDVISWVLHRTNAEIDGRETILQCAQSAHSSERIDKPNSCFSASALFLKAGDRLAVRNTGGDRHSLMEREKSFIGLVKLADAENPNEDF